MCDRDSARDRNPWEDWVISAALVLLWLGLAVAPRSLGPLVANVLGLALLAPLVIWCLWTGFDWRQVRLVALSGAVLLLLFVIAALRAANPRVAAVGLVYQHSGLLLWVGVIGWLIVAMGASAVRAQRRAVQTVSILGTVAVIAWAFDRLGLALGCGPLFRDGFGYPRELAQPQPGSAVVSRLHRRVAMVGVAERGTSPVDPRWLGGCAIDRCSALYGAGVIRRSGVWCAVRGGAAVANAGERSFILSGACVAGGLIAAALLFLGAAARSAALFDLVNRIGSDRMTTWRNALECYRLGHRARARTRSLLIDREMGHRSNGETRLSRD